MSDIVEQNLKTKLVIQMAINPSHNQSFTLNNTKYFIDRFLDANHIFARNYHKPDETITLSSADIQCLLLKEDIVFNNNHTVPNCSKFDFTELPAESQDEAKKRADYAIAVMEATRFKRSTKEASKAIKKCFKKRKDKKKPSLRSVRRWIERYISSGNSIRSLVTNNMSKGFRGPRDADLEEIINSAIDLHISDKSSTFNDFRSAVVIKISEQNEIRKEYHKNLIALPTDRLLRSRLKNIDPQYFIRNRFGKKAEAKIFRIIGSRKGPNRANQIWQADHTILDVFVLHDEYFLPIGKPRITAMIDVYTRCICGVYISFEPAGYTSVMHCLYNAVKTKEYIRTHFPEIENEWLPFGKPEIMIVDNALEFWGSAFEDAMLQIGVKNIVYAPVKESEFKAHIERFWLTINRNLLHSLPGATFADKHPKINELLKIGYDPIKDAVMTYSVFIKAFFIWLIDIYHQSKHRGLKGRTPQSAWLESYQKYPIQPLDNKIDLTALLGIAINRRINDYGIEYKLIIYNSRELQALKRKLGGQKVRLKVDPSNLSKLYVHDNSFQAFFEIPSVNPEYCANLTLFQHRLFLREARKEAKKVDIIALSRAREKIKELFKDMWHSRKIQTRVKAARFAGIGTHNLPKATENNFLENDNIKNDLGVDKPTSINLGEKPAAEQKDFANIKPSPTFNEDWIGDYSYPVIKKHID